MAYPYDPPSQSMSNIWNSGSYTPEDMVVYIRDNYTPVNKTSMRNSVGYQLSLIQNFVNEHYLGREAVPVGTGYITQLKSSGIELSDANYTTQISKTGLSSQDSAQSIYVNTDGFTFTNGDDTTAISLTGFYTENSVMASYNRVDIGQDFIKFSTNLEEVTVTHDGSGGLNTSGTDIRVYSNTVGLYANECYIGNNGGPIEGIYTGNGSLTLDNSGVSVVSTDIPHTTNVSLVYFAFHGVTSAQLYKDNWLPGNYSPYPSGLPVMSNSSTLAGFQPTIGDAEEMQYGVHLLQKASPSAWHIVLGPINSKITALYGNPVEYIYTLIAFN